MIDKRAFTLIEMLVVITITGILIGIATINFQSWTEIRNIEKQTREVHADLLEQRLGAMQQKQRREVVFDTNQINFNRYSSSEATPTLIRSRVDRYAMGRLSAASSTGALKTITYNIRGQVETSSEPPYTQILVVRPQNSSTPKVNSGDNCIIVSDSITKIGRMENVSTCRSR